MKKYSIIKFIALIFIVAMSASLALAEQGGKGPSSSNKTQLKAGDSYDLFINNFNLPMDRDGVLADVAIGGHVGGGKLNGLEANSIFLFSGGFYLSGLTNGKIWTNGQMSASRIQDYIHGTYATGQNDSRAQLYVVQSSDADWSQSWQDWKDAVALGADYYDGNGNGVYDPLPINSSTKWNPSLDRPDILGDATVWCVYSDQKASAIRTFNDVSPQGIEIRQTVFAFNSKSIIGNMIFVRYKIVNTGVVADVLDSVYLSVVDDADIGDSGKNDLVGCDTLLNAGYMYHKTGSDDGKWGSTPPCFMVDFFQGPRSYIPGVTFTDVNGNGVYDAGDIALDTATDVRGKVMGIQTYPGAKNLGLSSFFNYPNGADPADRFQGRYYCQGLTKSGGLNDPCTGFGIVVGEDCKTIDPFFMYSGDPVAHTGWLHNTPDDQRQLSNTGPFKLVKNDTVSIIVAYIIGKGTDYLNSITVAKTYDITAQKIFDANFPSLPPPPPVVATTKTGDGFIDITWPTYKNIQYKAVDSVFVVSRNVHGFFVTQYFTNSKSAVVNNQPNSAIIARYDLRDSIQNIFYKVSNGGIDLREASAPDGNKLDSLVVADSISGRVKLRLFNDPSTGNSLIKGHEYYFTITEYTVNNWAVVNRATNTYGPSGDYYDPSGNAVEEFETSLLTVTMGSDEFSPSLLNTYVKKNTGPSSGSVKYLIVNQNNLTGDVYKVDFHTDNNPLDGLYTPWWSLKNVTTNKSLVDSSVTYNFDTTNYTGTPIEGFVPRIEPLVPEFGTPIYANKGVNYPDSSKWYAAFLGILNAKGVFYMGKDLNPPSASTVGIGYDSINAIRSTVISADQLRKVELRFGDSSYAYRYVNGFIGANLTAQRGSTVYAEGIAATDTVGKGTIGNWDAVTNHANGFFKVPFSAWVVDSANNEKRQLAVGFIERRKSLRGNPDGIWDPGLSLAGSEEVILIFNSPYDIVPHVEFTGDLASTPIKPAEVVKGYTLTASVSDSLKNIAKSPWLNTLYLVAMQRKGTAFYKDGDILTIPMVTYPYTSTDEFQFTTTAGGNLSAVDKKALFDKVNVFPNPLYGYNPQTSYTQAAADEPFVTFSNLPGDVTINIFTLSGTRIRTLTTKDKLSPTSPFLRWNLKNEDGLRAASGMYLAIVASPGFGNKVLKFAIIMPQKQIKSY
jgi:hypothetical protein